MLRLVLLLTLLSLAGCNDDSDATSGETATNVGGSSMGLTPVTSDCRIDGCTQGLACVANGLGAYECGPMTTPTSPGATTTESATTPEPQVITPPQPEMEPADNGNGEDISSGAGGEMSQPSMTAGAESVDAGGADVAGQTFNETTASGGTEPVGGEMPSSALDGGDSRGGSATGSMGEPLAGEMANTGDSLNIQGGSESDAVVETPTTDPIDSERPQGQCTVDADCPMGPQGQMSCTALPGGECLGCANDAECPGATICDWQRGQVCVEECDADDDCPAGLWCLGSGRCAAMRCQNGTCPDGRFGCSQSNYCARTICTPDIECPTGTTCSADGLCIILASQRNE